MNLADHLWQSTLFAGAAGLLTLALRRNRARVRHAVWLAASCKFLVPLSLLIAAGAQVRWRPATPVVGRSGIAVVMDQVSQPFAAVPLPLFVPAASRVPEFLFAIWACGFVGISCAWAVRWRRMRKAVRAASPLPLDIPVPAVCSESPGEPGVFGVFRPVLILPRSVCEALDARQLQAVIAHELCHVRHRDNLAAAVHMAVETLFWFHPLVWWIGRRMIAERERACDEEVLGLGNEPRVYAESILNVCKLCVESPLPCVSGVTGADLKTRIAGIMSRRAAVRLRPAQKLALAGAALAAVAVPLGIGLLHAPALRAQTAAVTETRPSFEVASIKPSAGGPGSSFGIDRVGDLTVKNVNLLNIIAHAYSVQAFQVLDAPGWTRSETWDIVTKREVERPEGPPKKATPQEMMADIQLRLQSLLEERCQLRVHYETKELPVLALVIAKGGPKLEPSDCVTVDPQNPPPMPAPGQPRPKFCGNLGQHREGPNAIATGYGNSMPDFARWLASTTGRTVVDRTGYLEKFNFTLQFTPEIPAGQPGADSAAENPAPDANGPSIFSALTEQLGLKLENSKGPVDVVVIDRVARPSGN